MGMNFYILSRLKISLSKIITSLLLVLFCNPLYAHLRWFVPTENLEPINLSWHPAYPWIIFGGIVFLMIATIIHVKAPSLDGKHQILDVWPKQGQWRMVSVLVGLSFVLTTVNNHFIAPNIQVDFGLTALITLQLVIAVIALTTLRPKECGILLILIVALSLIVMPLSIAIDYIFEFIALGLFFFYHKHRKIAVFYLRLGFGMQLMVLAIHNKFLNPALGLWFLNDHPWNFMPWFGFINFSNLDFVFSAGVAEFCFGLFVFFGIATRFVVLCLSFFFIMTAFLLGFFELVGHMPLFGIAFTLLSLGGGEPDPRLYMYRSTSAGQSGADQV
ncbi:MAG: hypothetical protein GY820_33590 [Gammaproteobacteria bacterium]|nr:hypothetical protein [Gammaproteobacteria bacterium]